MCEYVTGGGLRDQELPPSLLREGLLIRDALARDLADLPDVTLVTTHDDRLPAPRRAASVPVCAGRDVWRLWSFCARSAEVAWVIAPETGGVLARLSEACSDAGAMLVGPDAETIRIGSSKRATAARLLARGAPALPVWRPEEAPPDAGPVVAKPDDGAGCEDVVLWPAPPERAAAPRGHVLQPYEAGEAASLTVLKAGGRTTLLAANRQHVSVEANAFRFRGVTIGALPDADGSLQRLAGAVTQALPGLNGIFGIDVAIGERGPKVVEVNPRLTTSYAGLREALGQNPAALVEPFATAGAPPPALAARSHEIAW